ncbi:MAG TPA: lysophospholipid acyltransferase family protein [Archangium sp.]
MFRNVFCVLVAIVWTLLMGVLTFVAMIVTLNRSASMFVVQKWWSPVLLWAGGAKLSVEGLENLKPGQPYIFISNHQSTIDIPVLFTGIPWNTRFVAKKALKYVPMLGWYMWAAKFIFVDRGNHREAVRSLDEAGEQIRGGIRIMVFPEGTRSDVLTVRPFKKGPFALAMKARVPIVPVAIEGSGKLMPKNSWNITPGPIRLKVGVPIPPEKYAEDRDGLIREVRNSIIDQSLAIGGKGGDKTNAVAARGLEGISERDRDAGVTE